MARASRSQQNKPPERAGPSAGVSECIGCRVPRCNDGMRARRHRFENVFQECRISGGCPLNRRARLIAKTRPIDRNRAVIRTQALLQRPHFAPGRDRAQCGQQKHRRPLPIGVKAEVDGVAAPRPCKLCRLHVKNTAPNSRNASTSWTRRVLLRS